MTFEKLIRIFKKIDSDIYIYIHFIIEIKLKTLLFISFNIKKLFQNYQFDHYMYIKI